MKLHALVFLLACFGSVTIVTAEPKLATDPSCTEEALQSRIVGQLTIPNRSYPILFEDSHVELNDELKRGLIAALKQAYSVMTEPLISYDPRSENGDETAIVRTLSRAYEKRRSYSYDENVEARVGGCLFSSSKIYKSWPTRGQEKYDGRFGSLLRGYGHLARFNDSFVPIDRKPYMLIPKELIERAAQEQAYEKRCKKVSLATHVKGYLQLQDQRFPLVFEDSDIEITPQLQQAIIKDLNRVYSVVKHYTTGYYQTPNYFTLSDCRYPAVDYLEILPFHSLGKANKYFRKILYENGKQYLVVSSKLIALYPKALAIVERHKEAVKKLDAFVDELNRYAQKEETNFDELKQYYNYNYFLSMFRSAVIARDKNKKNNEIYGYQFIKPSILEITEEKSQRILGELLPKILQARIFAYVETKYMNLQSPNPDGYYNEEIVLFDDNAWKMQLVFYAGGSV